MLILERKGNRNTRRKILITQERSSIHAQLAHEQTTPDLVLVVKIFHLTEGVQIFPWGCTGATGLRSFSVAVFSYDLVVSHTKL